MALTQGNPITADDMNAFKGRITAEMSRRHYTDSLASYAIAFSTAPVRGQAAKESQFDETVGYINLIYPTGITKEKINAIEAASLALDTYAEVDPTYNGECCTGNSCRGLCYTTCSGGCRGTCTANCADNCSGGCKGGCTSCSSCSGCSGCTGCSGSCSGCSGSCSGSCSGCDGCSGGCQGGCESNCAMNCTVDCGFNCYQSSY